MVGGSSAAGSSNDEGERRGGRGFGVYVHVPFCTVRCGYCDFNSYALADGADPAGFVDALLAELALADRALGGGPGRTTAGTEPRTVDTLFVGGGTPTVLPVRELARLLDAVARTWGFAPDAEITTEANPETVDPRVLRGLRAAGFTRISLGAQSAVPHVLAVLGRRHSPGQAFRAAVQAREAGFEHVNLDLIYGTPGESAADFAASLAAAIDAGVDHVSGYALTIEPGTPLARRIRRGEVPAPDDDEAADRYLAADRILSGAGFQWYEVSNWAAGAGARCRHNLGYWHGADWWGLGPGAHSHVGGVRWWNVKHPNTYRDRLSGGESPEDGREMLTAEDDYVESIMLGLRLAEGLPLAVLRPEGLAAAGTAVGDGLLEEDAWQGGRARLTLRGRLLADAVIRRLLS